MTKEEAIKELIELLEDAEDLEAECASNEDYDASDIREFAQRAEALKMAITALNKT